jgi:hypothetical protein
MTRGVLVLDIAPMIAIVFDIKTGAFVNSIRDSGSYTGSSFTLYDHSCKIFQSVES